MSSPLVKTPESYFAGLRRKDSKNALTTCHGVTDKGRACRRSLSSPKNSSKFDGAVVITANDQDPAVFFCWQHKEQADLLNADEGSVVSLKGRHSLEEAFRNLGLEDVDEEEAEGAESSPAHETKIPEPTRTVAYDQNGHDARPEKVTPRKRRSHDKSKHHRPEKTPETTPRPKTSRRKTIEEPQQPQRRSFFSSLIMCCFSDEPLTGKSKDSDREKNIDAPKLVKVDSRRHERKKSSRPRASGEQVDSRQPSMEYRRSGNLSTEQEGIAKPPKIRRREVPSHRRNDSGVAAPERERKHHRRSSEGKQREGQNNLLDVPTRTRPDFQVYNDLTPSKPPRQPYLHPSLAQSDHPALSNQRPTNLRSKSTPDPQQLGRIHGEWPPPLPRQVSDTTRICYAKLLTVMSEPPSKTDMPGYIYIFWQTDVQQTDDETSAVASIISAPADRGLQRQETILQKRFFQTSANARLQPKEKKTLFLKIGRATNVHQRLTQWKKQCEYDISLLRSYPYERKGSSPKPVPNVVKVERLIHLHLEMLGQRVKKECRCGTEHKEWFEVGAEAKAVREVDEIVRKWVAWSEDRFGQ